METFRLEEVQISTKTGKSYKKRAWTWWELDPWQQTKSLFYARAQGSGRQGVLRKQSSSKGHIICGKTALHMALSRVLMCGSCTRLSRRSSGTVRQGKNDNPPVLHLDAGSTSSRQGKGGTKFWGCPGFQTERQCFFDCLWEHRRSIY